MRFTVANLHVCIAYRHVRSNVDTGLGDISKMSVVPLWQLVIKLFIFFNFLMVKNVFCFWQKMQARQTREKAKTVILIGALSLVSCS